MYRKSVITIRKERKRQRALRQVEARRRRMVEGPEPDWMLHEHLLRFAISPDGRTVALRVGSGWCRVGSERTIRCILARAIWDKTKRRATI